MSKHPIAPCWKSGKIDPVSRAGSGSNRSSLANPHLPIKFHENQSATFKVILLTEKQTDKPTKVEVK